MASVELITAMAYDRATFDEVGLADPVIRLLGELPSDAQPFNLNRVYKGAQGVYEESILLVGPDGKTVLWQRPYRKLELRGEMFEDLFRSEVRDRIRIDEPGEHAMVFLLNGSEAGRIPVFIDAQGSAVTQGAIGEAVQKALSKGSIMWLSIPQLDGTSASRPAWYVQQGPKLFVFKGGSEQELPNLENCDLVDVTVQAKDIKATIGVVKADVRVVDNGDDEFDRIAALGMGTRLNLPDGEGALERWRSECQLVELTLQA